MIIGQLMVPSKKSVFDKQVASYFNSFLHANVSCNEVLVCRPAGSVFGEGNLYVIDRGFSLTWLLWPIASGSQ